MSLPVQVSQHQKLRPTRRRSETRELDLLLMSATSTPARSLIWSKKTIGGDSKLSWDWFGRFSSAYLGSLWHSVYFSIIFSHLKQSKSLRYQCLASHQMQISPIEFQFKSRLAVFYLQNL